MLQSASGFCEHTLLQADMLTIITTCSSSRCHMSPCPWHWESPEITYCSVTHIITQGSQITARQMDPDGCLDCVWDGLPEIWWNKKSTITDWDCCDSVLQLTAFEPPLFPPQLFERAPLRLTLPSPLPMLVSPCSRKSVPPCRLSLWPSEASGTEVTLWVLWIGAPFSIRLLLSYPFYHTQELPVKLNLQSHPLMPSFYLFKLTFSQTHPSADNIFHQWINHRHKHEYAEWRVFSLSIKPFEIMCQLAVWEKGEQKVPLVLVYLYWKWV